MTMVMKSLQQCCHMVSDYMSDSVFVKLLNWTYLVVVDIYLEMFSVFCLNMLICQICTAVSSWCAVWELIFKDGRFTCLRISAGSFLVPAYPGFQVVLEKRPLNRCISSFSSYCMFKLVLCCSVECFGWIMLMASVLSLLFIQQILFGTNG